MSVPFRAPLVALHDVTLAAPDGRILLDHLDLSFGTERTGLVGRNGAGKSTLLKLIASGEPPRAGSIERVGRIALLKQGIRADDGLRVCDIAGVGDAFDRLARLSAGEGSLDDAALADWTLETRYAAALAATGLPVLDPERPAAALSGGQRTRLALAALLLAEPDMILLDEPTDSLDRDGRAAVAELIANWKGGALVASHDRTLLRAMDQIVELSALGARSYGGGYDFYAAKRAEERAAAAERLDIAERSLKQTRERIQTAAERKAHKDGRGRRERAKGDTPKIMLDAARERSEKSAGAAGRLAERQMETAGEALTEAQAAVERVAQLAFALPSSGLAERRQVLEMRELRYGHPDGPLLFDGLDLVVSGPERIGITGGNGTGKSTLLRLAAGELEPLSGTVRRPVASVLLDQELALFDRRQTILDAFRRLNPQATINEAHAALARFLFRNEEARRPVSSLSGGEALRAALAAVLCGSNPPQLLILDEPTNHLDLDSVQAVEQALRGYDGALMVASHDADFLEALGLTRRVVLPVG